MTIRVAVVGAGSMAREHIRAFNDIADVEVVGIYSRTQSRAQELARELSVHRVYLSVLEMYSETNADLVLIAVPELAARRVSLDCFEFPWSVLMEKPAGYNLEDAQAISAAAHHYERQVFVGLNRRFLSSTQFVLNDLTSVSGKRFIHVQDQQSLETAVAIGHPKEVIQNWMYANSIHLIDYLTLLGRGPVTKVQPIWPWNGGRASVVAAAVEFASGDKGLYEGIWKGPGPWAVTVTTDQKRWEMRPLEQVVYQPQGERKLYPVPGHEWDQQFKPGFRLQAEEVIKAVRGEPSQAPTIKDAMSTMELIHALFA